MDSYDFKKKVTSVFCVLVFVMFVILMLNVIFRSTARTDFGLEYTCSVYNDWKQENGEFFDFSSMYDYEKDALGFYCAYYTLPSQIEEGTSVIFRSVDCIVEFYVNDEFQYGTRMVDGPLYSKSPGTRWNVVQIRQDAGEKVITLKIKPVYYDGRGKLDNIIMGDRASLILSIIGNNIVNIILCFMMSVLGIVFLCYSVVMKVYNKNLKVQKRKENDFGMGYLAVFAILASIWCMIETDVLQLFLPDLRQISVVGDMIFLFGGIPLIMYLDNCYGVLNHAAVRLICVADIIFVSLAVVLHLTGIMDFHESSVGAVVYYGIIVLIIFLCLMTKTNKYIKDREFKIYYIIQQIAMICLIIGIVTDALRYFVFNVTDKAMVVRIGLVFFFLFLGIGNIYRAIKLVGYGMKAELISNLAYTDGLTEVGNRTAYQEKLDEIETEFSDKLGIIIFDVNNLKAVNDNYGHAAGDDIICTSAELIFETFGKYGDVFRIGGDEFAVLIPSENPQEIYDKLLPVFQERMNQRNRREGDRIPIVVAHGFACAQEIKNDSIHEAIQEADRHMYEDKKNLKKIHPITV